MQGLLELLALAGTSIAGDCNIAVLQHTVAGHMPRFSTYSSTVYGTGTTASPNGASQWSFVVYHGRPNFRACTRETVELQSLLS